MRIVRSQLSDHEQVLLYYNGLSGFGKAWNIRNKELIIIRDVMITPKVIHGHIYHRILFL